jgi:type 1 glutamine amidotransferase
MKSTRTFIIITAFLLAAAVLPLSAAEKLKVLIVDGQNNHDWRTTTPMLKWILEDCGRFTVGVSTTPPEKSSPDLWKEWHPKFTNYDVILLNYNGERWPEEVRKEFVEYVRNGGGLVVVHAADNAFADWPDYNDMIAVGGWGGRNEQSGPMIRWRDGKRVLDTTPGSGGTHGAACPYVVNIIVPDHPMTKGLPPGWMHAKDELYGRLRGPCQNVTVLANALSCKETGGTGEIEPVLLAIDYGKGRVFHDVLGHDVNSMSDVGFQTTLQRGTEWAATGKVTLPAPKPEELATDKVVAHKPPR